MRFKQFRPRPVTSPKQEHAFGQAVAELGVADRFILGLSMIDACEAEDHENKDLAYEMLDRHLDIITAAPLPKN